MAAVDDRTRVRWLTAVIETPTAESERFWHRVTASTSDGSADAAGNVTLQPPDADPYVRLHRGVGVRVRVVVHVADPSVAAERAAGLGAARLERDDPTSVVSPGGLGLAFAIVDGPRHKPEPMHWPGGHRSILDQVCVDISPDTYDVEVAFLAALLGWPVRPGVRAEFDYLVRQPEQALRVLLQRLDEPARGPTRTHLDLACDSVPDEMARHLALGATVAGEYPHWTTLRDPAGAAYCLTRRNPATGML